MDLTKIKAFIFDFDGVIVDSEQQKYKKLNEIIHNLGYPKLIIKMSDFIGKKTEKILRDNYKSIPDEDIIKIIKKKRKLDTIHHNLVPGIRELLKYLHGKFLLAIATGTDITTVKKALARHELNFFDIIISGEDFRESKPNPECYIITLKKLGIKPQEAIVIEDSPAGIAAAKEASIKVIAISTYLPSNELLAADYYFNNPIEILKNIKKSKE